MGVGAILQITIGLDNYGVKLLPDVVGTMPDFVMPVFKKKTRAAGAISVPVPEGFRAAGSSADGGYLLTILPEDGGQAFRIDVCKPYFTGISAKQWKETE